MQQPYATAMAHGVGLYSRRGKAVKFKPEGEWLAIHCGQNSEHLNNKATMDAVRKLWPDCPSDSELKAQQRSIVGIAHFVEGDCNASAVAAADPLLRMYDCSKLVAWRADAALPWPGGSTPYPKGNLQIWHVARSGFSEKGAGAELLALAEAGAAMGGADVKPNLQPNHPGGRPRAKVEVKAEVKAEGGEPDAEEPPKKRKRK